MDMKYRITSETRVVDNITLHRIECVTAFGDVKCGEKGGWIESEKNLSQDGNAWVYDNAMVFDNARVDDNATVFGYSTVFDNARVDDNARVCGHATVYGYAEVGDDATVGGNAKVGGNATFRENATVRDSAWVCGYATVFGYSTVRDSAWVGGDAMVSGNATVGGNAKVGGNVRVGGDAMVYENADYIVFINWWSSGRYFTWTRSNNKWKVGSFYGSGEELIKKAYEDSLKSGREYERVVKYVESILQEEDNGNRNKREG